MFTRDFALAAKMDGFGAVTARSHSSALCLNRKAERYLSLASPAHFNSAHVEGFTVDVQADAES